MIIGIGCDIVDHNLTRMLNWKNKTSLKNRVFSSEEQDIFKEGDEISFMSGRFAAKEAVLKCLRTGIIEDISLGDIQILQDPNGCPVIKLRGTVKEISDALQIVRWFVSISHSRSCSIAYVVAEA